MLARRLLALWTSVAALNARIRRWLPGRRRSLPAPPAAGIYRARPDLPPLPPEPPPPSEPPPPPDPRRKPLVHALGSSLLAAAGMVAVMSPRHADHRFWGVLGVILFGAAAWVFWEQVAAGLGTAPLTPRARRRTFAAMGMGGLAAVAMALGSDHVTLRHRVLAAVMGLLLVLPALVEQWRSLRDLRAARAAQTAPRRRPTDERRPPSLVAARSFPIHPPPTPDLRVQRRRWRRRG